MSITLLERLGDWNPQLFREVKGRLQVRNIALTIGSSLLGQLLLFLGWWRREPPSFPSYSVLDKACRLRDTFLSYQEQDSQLEFQYRQLQEQFRSYSGAKNFNPEKLQTLKGKIADVKGRIENLKQVLNNKNCPEDSLNIQLWWQNHYGDLFILLATIFVFLLLVGGTYLLINDLSQEERKGTLNFIRLTPRSETSILTGKMLGVPILLYLLVAVAVPLHLWAGLSAKIPLSLIFTFYGVLIVSCIYFYSAALLFGLVITWLGVGGFQAWLGSGAIFAFLVQTLFQVNRSEVVNHSMVWLRLFSPFELISYLFASFGSGFATAEKINSLQWFYLEVGGSTISLVALIILNYGLWTYWIWQGLKRSFRNPNLTIISKLQSYWIVVCLEVIIWGFALQKIDLSDDYLNSTDYFLNLVNSSFFIICFNVLLLLSLIAVLSPRRQTLQEWVRSRLEKTSGSKISRNIYLVKDLIVGEKSPAIVAMAINLVIVALPIVIFTLLGTIHYYEHKSLSDNKIFLLCCIASFITMMMIYASIAQLMLLMKNPKRSILATVTIAGLILVPPIMLNVLGINFYDNLTLWLVINFPGTALAPYLSAFSMISFETLEYPTMTAIFMAFLCHCGILALLNLQLARQLQKFGESVSKSLLKDPPTLPSSSFK